MIDDANVVVSPLLALRRDQVQLLAEQVTTDFVDALTDDLWGCKKPAGTSARAERHAVRAMLEYLLLLLGLVRAAINRPALP